MKIVVLVALTAFFGQAVSFQMVDFSPKNSSVTVKSAGFLDLSCKVDKFIRSCIWRHNGRSCELTWSRDAKDLVVKRKKCSIEKERFEKSPDLVVRGSLKRPESTLYKAYNLYSTMM